MNKLRLRITGKNPNYFLEELINNKINIYDLKKDHHNLEVVINYNDYELIKEIKTTYKITIINRYGFNKYMDILKRYSLFFICLIIGLLINILLSNLIFKVEVINSNKKLVSKITKDLESLGLKKYHFKVDYQTKEKIEKKILSKEKDILEWIEIEEKGTKYLVKITERKKPKKEEKCNSRHLIAKKSAIITDIEVTSGEIIAKENNYVEKGEILVSGLIHNKDKVVKKVCSKGTIYGETWYKATITLDKEKINKHLLKEYSYGLNLNIINLNKKIIPKFRNYQIYRYNIIRDRIIPINFSFIKYQKIKIIKHNKSDNYLEKEALILTSKELKKRLKENENIISKKVLKKKENNSKIKIEVFFKVKEDITSYQDISNINIDDLNKEGD